MMADSERRDPSDERTVGLMEELFGGGPARPSLAVEEIEHPRFEPDDMESLLNDVCQQFMANISACLAVLASVQFSGSGSASS